MLFPLNILYFVRQLLLSTVDFFKRGYLKREDTMSHPIFSWFLMVCCICLWSCLWIVQKDQKKAGNVSVVSGSDFDSWSCSHLGLLLFLWGMCHLIDNDIDKQVCLWFESHFCWRLFCFLDLLFHRKKTSTVSGKKCVFDKENAFCL